jgi:fucose 4-O-acetylase-like acetyltransferase
MEERKKNIDIFKGLLIILVVVGHYDTDIVHDVIFLFHMPLFFIISGLLLKKDHLMEGTKYIKTKIQNLMIPYVVYLVIDLFFIRQDYAAGSIVRALWGGRAVSGVYWYITCFLFTLFLFSVMVRYLSEKATKCLILMGGVQRFSNRIL